MRARGLFEKNVTIEITLSGFRAALFRSQLPHKCTVFHEDAISSGNTAKSTGGDSSFAEKRDGNRGESVSCYILRESREIARAPCKRRRSLASEIEARHRIRDEERLEREALSYRVIDGGENIMPPLQTDNGKITL